MESHCLNEWVIESFIQTDSFKRFTNFHLHWFSRKTCILPPLCWFWGYSNNNCYIIMMIRWTLTCESLSDLLVPGRVGPLSPPSALSVCRAICPPAAGASWETPRAGGSSQTACLRWRWMKDLLRMRMSMDRAEAVNSGVSLVLSVSRDDRCMDE